MAGLTKELLEARLPTKSGLKITCTKPCLTSVWDMGMLLPASEQAFCNGLHKAVNFFLLRSLGNLFREGKSSIPYLTGLTFEEDGDF